MIYRKNIDKNARDTYVINSIQSASIGSKVVGIIPVRSRLVSVQEVHGTAAGQAGVLGVERLQAVETSGNGDDVVIDVDLEETANTVQDGTIVTTSDIDIYEAGDRVGTHVYSGSAASAATMVVTLQFRPIDS